MGHLILFIIGAVALLGAAAICIPLLVAAAMFWWATIPLALCILGTSIFGAFGFFFGLFLGVGADIIIGFFLAIMENTQPNELS